MGSKPNLEEVGMCIQSLKNNKSPGFEGIPTEVLKYGEGNVFVELNKLIEAIWEIERVAYDWK